MKTTVSRSKLLSTILLGVALTAGCSSFESPSSEYVKPGELCVDVSDLPDPNAPTPRKDETAIRNIANQFGTAGRQESPERLLLQADSYFEQKRYHDSARLYKKYLNTPAASSATTEQLATIHYRIGFVADKKTFYAEARDEFAKAVQLAPTSLDYLYAYAKACYDAQDYATADAQFVALLSRAPSHRDGLYYYGLTLLEGSNRAQAIAPLTSSVGALEARALLADKYYALGDLPNATAAENDLVQLAAQLGKPIPALPHKEKILASAQNNALYAQNVSVNLPTQNADSANVAANVASTNPLPNPQAVAQVAPQASPIPEPAFVAQAPTTPAPTHEAPAINAPKVEAPQIQAPQVEAPQGEAPQAQPQRPHFAQIGPAPVQNRQPQPPTAAPANPTPTPATTIPAPQPQPQPQPAPVVEPPLAQPAQPVVPAPQLNPTTQDLGAFPTFESVAPTLPAETSVPQNIPQNVPQNIPQPAPELPVADAALPPIEPFPGFDDDWDDSAFATSGGSENASAPQEVAAPQVAPQQVAPQQVVPQQVVPQQITPLQPIQQAAQQAAPRQAIPQQAASAQGTGVPQQPSSYQYAPISPRYGDREHSGVISTSYVAPKLRRLAARRIADEETTQDESDREQIEASVDEANVDEASADEDSENNGPFALVVRGEVTDLAAPQPLARAESPTFRVDAPVSNAAPQQKNKGKIRSTANFGPSNPGLFAVSSAAPNAGSRLPSFKPGSINDDENVEENVPDEVAAKIVASQTRAPRFVAEAQVMPPAPAPEQLDQYENDLENLENLENLANLESLENLEDLEEAAPERFAIRLLSPGDAFQIFDRLETLADMENEYLATNEDEDFAFATSGAPYAEPIQTPAPQRAPAGFGDYSAPEFVAFNAPESPAPQPAPAQPVAQPVPSPVAQPAAQPVAPRASVPQGAPIPQGAASPATRPLARSSMTAEEKLQAARNAGAQVMELTPDQYRAAISKGLGGN